MSAAEFTATIVAMLIIIAIVGSLFAHALHEISENEVPGPGED